MSEFLCIHIPPGETAADSESPVNWFCIDNAGIVLESGAAPVAELAETIPASQLARKVLVIVPGEQALLTNLEIPAQQQRHLKQVLPFIIEEQIIDPIEQMHLASSAISTQGTISVAAIRRDAISQWMELFNEIDLPPDYLLLDVLCLPEDDNQWHILFQGQRMLFRHGQYQGIVADSNMAKTVLQLAIAENLQEADGEPPSKVILSCSATQDVPVLNPEQDDLADDSEEEMEGAVNRFDSLDFRDRIAEFIRSENIKTEIVDYRETVPEILCVNAVRHLYSNLNLLQGDFRSTNANADNIERVKKTGVAIAACLALFMLFSFAGGYYLNYRADQYFDNSVALYKEIFPKQRRVIDPVKQLKRSLSGEAPGTTSDFLPLLDAASNSLAELGPENAATLTQLRYDSQRGDIVLDIRVGNIDVLETYKESLAGEGLKVDIMSANQNEKFVNGRIQIGRI